MMAAVVSYPSEMTVDVDVEVTQAAAAIVTRLPPPIPTLQIPTRRIPTYDRSKPQYRKRRRVKKPIIIETLIIVSRVFQKTDKENCLKI